MGKRPEDQKEQLNCLFCNGRLEKAMVPYSVNRKGYHLFIEKVPGHVCTQCGEKFFDEAEATTIQQALINFEKSLGHGIAA